MLSFADARALYAKVWWYGARACAERLQGGGFALGLPVYTALAHAPVMVETKSSLLARKPKFPLLLTEELVLAEYAVLTGGCAQNFEAARWVLSEAAARNRAVSMDRHGLEQPVLRPVLEGGRGAAPVAVEFVHDAGTAFAGGGGAQPLVANVHSIAHKLVELAPEVGKWTGRGRARRVCDLLKWCG